MYDERKLIAVHDCTSASVQIGNPDSRQHQNSRSEMFQPRLSVVDLWEFGAGAQQSQGVANLHGEPRVRCDSPTTRAMVWAIIAGGQGRSGCPNADGQPRNRSGICPRRRRASSNSARVRPYLLDDGTHRYRVKVAAVPGYKGCQPQPFVSKYRMVAAFGRAETEPAQEPDDFSRIDAGNIRRHRVSPPKPAG